MVSSRAIRNSQYAWRRKRCLYPLQTHRGASLLPKGTPEGLAALVYRAVVRKSRRVIYPRVYAASLWFPRLTRWFTDVNTPKLPAEPRAALPQ